MSNNEVEIQIKHMIQQGLADSDELLAIFLTKLNQYRVNLCLVNGVVQKLKLDIR